jgi:chromosome segregation ATPase
MKIINQSKTIAIATLILLAPTAFAEVSPRLSSSADQLRQAQTTQLDAERHVQSLREKIRAKKEVISQTESLKSKLISEIKKEQKFLDRDLGAGAEAREARRKIIQDKALRIEAASKAIEAKTQELQVLEGQLTQAKSSSSNAKQSRKAARDALKTLAEQERQAQACAERSFLRKVGGGLASLFDGVANIARSRAERDEHEVQKLMKQAYCDPASAVSERRQPKERETFATIPKAIPVSDEELAAGSAH